MREWFSTFAVKIADAAGSVLTFMVAAATVAACLAWGWVYGFSDRLMIVFNTAISTVTFLAVFLIQSAQNRNAKALHLKMNELIRGVEGPRTELVNLEQRTNAEMRELDKEFAQVAEEAIQEAPASPAQTKRKADPART